jgi:hypothetical protein
MGKKGKKSKNINATEFNEMNKTEKPKELLEMHNKIIADARIGNLLYNQTLHQFYIYYFHCQTLYTVLVKQ